MKESVYPSKVGELKRIYEEKRTPFSVEDALSSLKKKRSPLL